MKIRIQAVIFLLGMLLFSFSCKNPYEETSKQFVALKTQFLKDLPKLNIPAMNIAFVDNLKNIQPLDSIEQQLVFFKAIKEALDKIDVTYLDAELLRENQMLNFDCQMQLERLALEKRFRKNNEDGWVDEKGLYFNEDGKKWYAHFIKRWIGADITPEDLMKIGEEEVKKVQLEIQGVQAALGYANDTIGFYEHLKAKKFYEPDSNVVKQGFLERKKIVRKRLWNYFEEWEMPEEKIAKGTLERLSHVPGFYRSRQLTFYYNLFDKPYNIRQYDWLYLHEAVPGHHFQIALINQHPEWLSDLNSVFYFPGYVEGWAAYTEEMGAELGLYRTPYDWMGKHEWNIVRSVRVVLDIGINYLGWSDGKALSYWKTNIVNQDDIAKREIKRMQNWPGQVHTYKYGARQILKLKEMLEQLEGDQFDIKTFHSKILNKGPMPWKALEQWILTLE